MAKLKPTRNHAEMRLQDYDVRAQYPATVIETQRITPQDSPDEVRDILLEVRHPDFRITAGENVGVLIQGDPKFGQKYHLRLYSIADVPQATADGGLQIRLCVRRCNYIDDFSGEEFRGLASNFLCDLRPGDSVTLTGPYGPAFQLPKEPDATLILIGAGTGIAPFRALVKQLYQREPKFQGRVWLFFGARTGLELLYMNDIKNDFAQYYDKATFEAFAALSRRPHWSDLIDWSDVFEPRSDMLWKMLRDPLTYVYVAGVKAIRDELEAEFIHIAKSAENWAQRKAELQAGHRWTELLY